MMGSVVSSLPVFFNPAHF